MTVWGKWTAIDKGNAKASHGRYSMEVEKNELTDSATQGNPKARHAADSFSLESAYGSVEPSANPECFDVVSSKAKDEKAAKTVQELSESRKS